MLRQDTAALCRRFTVFIYIADSAKYNINTLVCSYYIDVSPYDDGDAVNTGLGEKCVNVVNLTSDFPVRFIAFTKTALGLNSHDHVM
jgi:hypothetical protein